MNIPVLFIALGGSIILWFFLMRRLRTKPWIENGLIDNRDGAIGVPAKRVGLWVFLAVVTSFFALFMVIYTGRSSSADWRPVPVPQLLWINTIFLLLGSVALQRARSAVMRDNFAGVKINLSAGGIFTILFLLGQLFVWEQVNSSGYFLATNPANAFFYLLTGLHGLHLLGGLWVWARTINRIWNKLGSLNVAQSEGVRLSIQLCSIYWHFLFILWLVLFYLLSST